MALSENDDPSVQGPLYWLQQNTTVLDTDYLVDGNVSTLPPLPETMRFAERHVVSIVTYSVLIVISGAGNLTVFVTLLRRRRQKSSRIDLMLIHLAIGDLLVTFIMMPLEVAWAATVSWWAGDAMCRIMAFFRTFGLYLSSFVLVCISIDRYFAVLHPLGLHDAYRRGKIMLAIAWAMSVVCSIPQMIVFHVEHHHIYTDFTQCMIFNSFSDRTQELAYYLFGMIAMYGLPLIVITASYTAILVEISKKSKECAEQIRTSGDDKLRRSGMGNLGRAKSRTLKMTVLIVAVFIMCWTPYYVMCLWYWFARESARRVDPRIQRGLFLFASSNSCMNPIVYGMFSLNCARDCRRLRIGRFRRKARGRSRGWSDRTERTAIDSQVLPDFDCSHDYTTVTETPMDMNMLNKNSPARKHLQVSGHWIKVESL